jgi:hypothetical protein
MGLYAKLDFVVSFRNTFRSNRTFIKKVDDTKGITRSRKSKGTQYNAVKMAKRKRTKGQTMIFKTLHMEIKTIGEATRTPLNTSDEQKHEHH